MATVLSEARLVIGAAKMESGPGIRSGTMTTTGDKSSNGAMMPGAKNGISTELGIGAGTQSNASLLVPASSALEMQADATLPACPVTVLPSVAPEACCGGPGTVMLSWQRGPSWP